MSLFFRRSPLYIGAIISITAFLYASQAYASNVVPEPFGDHDQLFGHQEVVHQGTAAFTKWTTAIKAQAKSKASEKTQEWKTFIATLRGLDPAEQLEAVNSYINTVRYVADKNNYGTDDYWATVGEFFERGGDCEDYALAKYYSLISLGFKPQQLRLVILYDENKRINHAVLAASLNGKWKILDNQSSSVRDDDEISNYKPIYAISKNNWWRFI